MIKFLLLTIFLAAYATLSLKRPKWALCLILAFPMSYLIRFRLAGVPVTLLESMILILFVVWVWGKWQRHERIKIDDHLWPWAGLLLLAGAISIFVSPNTLGALGIFKAYFIEPMIVFLMATDLLKRKDLAQIVFFVSIGAVLVGLWALGQRFFGFSIPSPWNAELRATSFFPYPNAVGLYLAPLMPWWVWKLTQTIEPLNKKRLWHQAYWSFIILLSLAAIYFAKTEAALVAIMATALIFGIVSKKTRWWTIGLGILTAIVLAVWPAIRSVIAEKIFLQDWSGIVRLASYGETWRMLADHAVFGAGLAGYQEAIVAYHTNQWMEIFLYPHNILLAIWSELGLLGLVAFGGIVSWFIRNLWQQRNLWSAALLASFLIIVIHGLVDVPYFKNDLAVMFWGIAALSNIKQ